MRSKVNAMRGFGIATLLFVLSTAPVRALDSNQSLLQSGLEELKQGDNRAACTSLVKLAARTKDFTTGVNRHANTSTGVKPETVAEAARKDAEGAPLRACGEAYLAALLALGLNDSVSVRAYAGEAALYAHRAGIDPSTATEANGATAQNAAPPATRQVALAPKTAAHGAAGAPPPGQYGCASAPAVLAGSGGYGTMLHQLGQWQGDIWILDPHRYAGPYHKEDVGTYKMQGDKLVALTGSYAPPRNKTEIVYAPAEGDHKAALHIAFLEADGKPSIGLWCIAK